MNLAKLFPIQKKLDERIEKEHGLKGQDLLSKKILALQVELGELANEWRGFKFWSNNQNPRIEVKCHACSGSGGFDIGKERTIDGEITNVYDPCTYCCGTGVQRRPLIEEYVDGLHFILSIGLELGIYEDWDVEEIEPVFCLDVTHQFIDLNEYLSPELDENDWHSITENYIGLGEMIGFTWGEIESAYLDKNSVNHERQEAGY